jgi:hypothetical protein
LARAVTALKMYPVKKERIWPSTTCAGPRPKLSVE